MLRALADTAFPTQTGTDEAVKYRTLLEQEQQKLQAADDKIRLLEHELQINFIN